jgi:hypothetical protein
MVVGLQVFMWLGKMCGMLHDIALICVCIAAQLGSRLTRTMRNDAAVHSSMWFLVW